MALPTSTSILKPTEGSGPGFRVWGLGFRLFHGIAAAGTHKHMLCNAPELRTTCSGLSASCRLESLTRVSCECYEQAQVALSLTSIPGIGQQFHLTSKCADLLGVRLVTPAWRPGGGV